MLTTPDGSAVKLVGVVVNVVLVPPAVAVPPPVAATNESQTAPVMSGSPPIVAVTVIGTVADAASDPAAAMGDGENTNLSAVPVTAPTERKVPNAPAATAASAATATMNL